jgi:hypothetical protein
LHSVERENQAGCDDVIVLEGTVAKLSTGTIHFVGTMSRANCRQADHHPSFTGWNQLQASAAVGRKKKNLNCWLSELQEGTKQVQVPLRCFTTAHIIFTSLAQSEVFQIVL